MAPGDDLWKKIQGNPDMAYKESKRKYKSKSGKKLKNVIEHKAHKFHRLHPGHKIHKNGRHQYARLFHGKGYM